MQSALVGQFPNVSVIDLRDVLQTVKDIVDNVTLAITVVGGLVLFSGSLILVGAVSMTKFQPRLRSGHPQDARGEQPH